MLEYKNYEIDVHLKSKIVTWAEYQMKIEELAEQIDESSYDYVIGVFQGGYIVAMSLADYLFKAKTGGVVSDINVVVFTEAMKMDSGEIQGKSILLVDEVVESGSSIKKCKNILTSYNVGKISTACIYCNIYSNEKIDYFVESFEGNKNFIFPWRINRDCVSLIMDVMQSNVGYDENTLINEIKKTYGVNVSKDIIIDTLKSNKKIFNKKDGRWYVLRKEEK